MLIRLYLFVVSKSKLKYFTNCKASIVGVGQPQGPTAGNDRRRCAVDKKTKKRIQTINKKLSVLRQALKGAKTQRDEPAEIARLEREVAKFETELESLKG